MSTYVRSSIYEPVSNIRYKFACAYSKDSNQSEHPHSLIRVIVEETLDPWLPKECPNKTNQIADVQASM